MVAQLLQAAWQSKTKNNTNLQNSDKTTGRQPFSGQNRLLKHKRRFCRESGCGRIVKSQGLCQRHGAKPKKCKIDRCEKQAQGSFDGMCKSHFRSICRIACTTRSTEFQDQDTPSPCDSNDRISISPFSTDCYNKLLENSQPQIQNTVMINRVVSTEQDQIVNLGTDRVDSLRSVRWNDTVIEGHELLSSNMLEISLSRPPSLSKRVFSIDTQFSFDIKSIDEDIDFEHAFDYNIPIDSPFPSTISFEDL